MKTPLSTIQLISPEEHCRECGGKGWWEEPKNTWGATAGPIRCPFCRGLGCQSVILEGRA